MGKTKTAFVGGTDNQPVKKGYDKAAKEAKRLAREKQEGAPEKVHMPGLKGGERIKAVEGESIPSITSETSISSESSTEKKGKEVKVRSLKYKEALSKINKNNLYTLPEAIALVKETTYSSFDGTMEMHMVIKKESFSVNVTLPHSFGKQKRVVVADETVIDQLKNGKIEFDILLSTADMMPKLVPFARLLGPRGLMPNPKTGTLIKNIKEAGNFSTSQTTIKTEKKSPVIHTAVGKVSQSDADILENIETVLGAVNTRQVLKIYLKSTMSPSVKVKVA